MENVLKARITADINDYKSKMAQVENITENATKEVIQLENALAQAKAEFKSGVITLDEYAKRVSTLNNDLARQRQVLNNARSGFQGVGASAGSANAIFQEFNRVVQDAPFGIIGVGNNLQQLASNFGTLRSQTGSTSQALKLGLGSLVSGINPAILAFTALTTVLTLYSQGVFGASKEVDNLKKAQDDLNDSLKETDKIARQGFYVEFLKELGLVKDVLLENGRIIKGVPVDSPLEEQLRKIAEAVKTATKPELEVLAQFLKENYQDATRTASNATTELEKTLASETASKYKGQLEIVNKELEFYKDKTDKAKKATKELGEAFDENVFRVQKASEASKLAGDKLEQLSLQLAKSLGLINPEIKDIKLDIDLQPEKVDAQTQQVIDSLLKYKKQLDLLSTDIARLLEDSLGNAIANVGFAIGEAISTGQNVFQAAGTAILQSFAQFLGQFGKLLIQYGVAGLAYSKITKALLNPLTAGPAALASIAAGAALLAISGAISGAIRGSGSQAGRLTQTGDTFTNVPGREFGGSVIANKPYIVGEKRPELFVPSTNGIIVPRIDNIGASSASGSASMGGKLTVEVIGMIENDSIRLANKKGMQKVSRT